MHILCEAQRLLSLHPKKTINLWKNSFYVRNVTLQMYSRQSRISIHILGACVCVWTCTSVCGSLREREWDELRRWTDCVCVCVCVHQGVGALVRVRQQRVPQLSRNLSQSNLTNRERERARERGGPGDELRGKKKRRRRRRGRTKTRLWKRRQTWTRGRSERKGQASIHFPPEEAGKKRKINF